MSVLGHCSRSATMIDPSLMANIRRRAYEIWQYEGCPDGRHRIHWIRAEAEFREKLRVRQPASPKLAARSLKRNHAARYATGGPRGTETRSTLSRITKPQTRSDAISHS